MRVSVMEVEGVRLNDDRVGDVGTNRSAMVDDGEALRSSWRRCNACWSSTSRLAGLVNTVLFDAGAVCAAASLRE